MSRPPARFARPSFAAHVAVYANCIVNKSFAFVLARHASLSMRVSKARRAQVGTRSDLGLLSSLGLMAKSGPV
jgi:hypothetical protein